MWNRLSFLEKKPFNIKADQENQNRRADRLHNHLRFCKWGRKIESRDARAAANGNAQEPLSEDSSDEEWP